MNEKTLAALVEHEIFSLFEKLSDNVDKSKFLVSSWQMLTSLLLEMKTPPDELYKAIQTLSKRLIN